VPPAAAQNGGKHGRPDIAIRGVHGELVQQHVAGKPAGGLRVGGQSHDPHAVGPGDLQLPKAGALEEPIPQELMPDSQRLAVLPHLLHQFGALALAGRQKHLHPPALQTPQ